MNTQQQRLEATTTVNGRMLLLATDRDVALRILSTVASLFTLVASSSGITNMTIYTPLTPDVLLPGTLSQDITSLAVALVLLTSIHSRCTRQTATTLRQRVVWLGLLAYLLYAYGIYTFEPVCNELYLVYVCVFATCLWTIILFFSSLSYDRLATLKVEFPRKTLYVLFGLLGTIFPILWLSILLPAMRAKTVPDGSSIFALDLSFGIPMLWVSIWLIGKPVGYVVVPAVLIKVRYRKCLCLRTSSAYTHNCVVAWSSLDGCSGIVRPLGLSADALV